MAHLVMAASALYGSKSLFDFNRENYQFDQDQRIKWEQLRMKMQLKRFDLFRQDIRDLSKLTVDRMDIYHLVGALFLQFITTLVTKGRIQANTPPFVLSLFMLSNGFSFVYLLLAVWMSMHASIAAHSMGVRLLTRFVRLPIASQEQMRSLTYRLKDFEREGIGKLLRVPFQGRVLAGVAGTSLVDVPPPTLDAARHSGTKALPTAAVASSNNTLARSGLGMGWGGGVPPGEGPPRLGGRGGGPSMPVPRRAPPRKSAGSILDQCAQQEAREAASAPWVRQRSDTAGSHTDDLLLPQDDFEHVPTVGDDADEDLFSGGGLPERHVELFRQLQCKWQCYDAYCRVCMSLGVNQLLQVLSYYALAHTLVENHSPSTGIALVVSFQFTTVFIAVLDVAGLRQREILAIQAVGMLPCFLTAWSLALARRHSLTGAVDPEDVFPLSPLAFLFTFVWLELWLRVSAPKGDRVSIPMRYRQMLFLDVFGDAANGWDPRNSGEAAAAPDLLSKPLLEQDDDEVDDQGQRFDAVAQRSLSEATVAQHAARRWLAVPQATLSAAQQRELAGIVDKLGYWVMTLNAELERAAERRGLGEQSGALEPELCSWSELSPAERRADSFAGCLAGPLVAISDPSPNSPNLYFSAETARTLRWSAGARVLTLEAFATAVRDVEKGTRELLETRIVSDLQGETRRRRIRAEEERRIAAASAPDLSAMMPDRSFPNLVSMSTERVHFTAGIRSKLLRAASSMNLRRAITPPQPLEIRDPPQRDLTLVAMAGREAKHFAPDRLPWLILRRMTNIMQLCCLGCFLMAFLKEVNVFQHDFGIKLTEEEPSLGRRLSAAVAPVRSFSFEVVQVTWPLGEFFQPQGLFCPPALDSERSEALWVGSSFAIYSLRKALGEMNSSALHAEEALRGRLPPSTTVICGPWRRLSSAATPGQHPITSCLLAAPTAGGLALWRAAAGDASSAGYAPRIALPWEGVAWKLVAGAAVPCGNVSRLLPANAATASAWCLAFAGWDGKSLSLAAAPLPETPEASSWLGASAEVDEEEHLGLGAPLHAVTSVTRPEGVDALHIEPRQGRLWVLLANGDLETWDLFAARSLGRRRPRWLPGEASSFLLASLCEQRAGDGRSGALFAIARRTGGLPPLLLRAEVLEDDGG